jgi:hypothetical protein
MPNDEEPQHTEGCRARPDAVKAAANCFSVQARHRADRLPVQVCPCGRLTSRVHLKQGLGFGDDVLDQVGSEHLPEGGDHGSVEGVLPEPLAVPARPVLSVDLAYVVGAADFAPDGMHRALTGPAPDEPAKVRGLEPGLGAARLPGVLIGSGSPCEARLYRRQSSSGTILRVGTSRTVQVPASVSRFRLVPAWSSQRVRP